MPQTVFPGSSNKTRTSSIGAYIHENELLMTGLVLVLFLAVCACMQSRYIPWGDEVQFVDPAANLYSKLGFVSTEWANQTDRTFWAGNAPGYSMLLYLFFCIVHFSQTVARSVNDVTMALAVFFLWSAVRRGSWLAHPNTRLLMLVLVLTGYGCYSCYENIRYDGLCFLECALAFWACTVPRPIIRNVCFFVIGAVMILTNLQMPQYVLLLLLILTYAYSAGFGLLWKVRFLFLGFVAGGASLFLLYASHSGALTAFWVTLRQQAGQSVWEKLQDLPNYFQYDFSLAALLLFLLASFWVVRRHSTNPRARQPVIAGLLLCTVIPVFFFLARRYVFSSAWMVYIPAAVCVCQVLEARINPSRGWKTFAVLCCAVSMGFGLPKALAGMLNEWSLRNYAVVEAFVAANVRTGDVVFCEPAAYFAARPRAARVYGPGYLDVINAAEKKAITLVIVAPENEARVIHAFGGKWIAVRQLVRNSESSSEKLLPISTNFSCRLNVLRRS